MVEAWNKIDLLAPEELDALWATAGASTGVNLVSAAAGTGLAPLLEAVDRRLARNRTVIELDLDYGAGEIVAWLHRHGEVLERTDDGSGLHLKVAIAAPERAQLAQSSAGRSSPRFPISR